MTSILNQRARKQGDGSMLLPWVLLAATTTAVVVVRQRFHRRHRPVASKIGHCHHDDDDDGDEQISELTNPLPEDQDLKETAVDRIPGMFPPFREVQKGDEDNSNDGTAQTDTSFQSETMEI